MTNLTAKYNSSVLTPAGWRPVTMTATLVKISEKRATVSAVSEIDGIEVGKYMSRGGAKRQQFNGQYFAELEAGKVKNISSLKVLESA